MSEAVTAEVLDRLEANALAVGDSATVIYAGELLALVAAARESTPDPTEALVAIVASVPVLNDWARRYWHDDAYHPKLALTIEDYRDRLLASVLDAARTAPASEVAATSAEAVQTELRALHRRGSVAWSMCAECAVKYPCPTVAILDRIKGGA